MTEPIRILHIFHEMANGGVEHFVMDYYRHIDRTKVQFDFLVSVNEKGYFEDEIKALGGKIFHAYPLKHNPIKNFNSIKNIVKDNHYKIVHRHTGSAFGYFDLHAAKLGGANSLILHSHNNQAGNKYLHFLFSHFLKTDCIKLACSKEAGEFLFGNNSEFKIINNAIECDRFKFNSSVREKIRSELDLNNKIVIGHVGRFENQKNHIYMIDLMKKLKKINPNFIIVCIGVGSLMDSFKKKVSKENLDKNFKFLGARNDVNDLMQAFDLFILPSLYEGFPFVLVEAQASGLVSFVSTNVPVECNVTGNVNFINLDCNDDWVKMIINSVPKIKSMNRENLCDFMIEKGYDINKNAKQLLDFYNSLSKNK